jgi:hypothetical protein
MCEATAQVPREILHAVEQRAAGAVLDVGEKAARGAACRTALPLALHARTRGENKTPRGI